MRRSGRCRRPAASAVKAIADVRSLEQMQQAVETGLPRAREDRHRLRERRDRDLGGCLGDDRAAVERR